MSDENRVDESVALQPVEVEGWTLFAGEGGHWVHDLDLASRAKKTPARKIRPVIHGVIKDGMVKVDGPAAAEVLESLGSPSFSGGHGAAATVWARKLAVPSGNRGGTQETVEFYLDQEAAIYVLIRLRTEPAMRATKGVVKVFLAVARGEYVGPAAANLLAELADMRARADFDRQEIAILRAKNELVDPTSSGLIGDVRAGMIRGLVNEAARIAALVLGKEDASTIARERKERDNEVRGAVGFVHGIEHRWDHLPLKDFGHALLKAHEILGREKKRLGRAAAEADARVKQLDLPASQKTKNALVKLPFKETVPPAEAPKKTATETKKKPTSAR